MAAVPPTHSSSFPERPLILRVIDGALPLPGIRNIHIEAIGDEDLNHRVSLTFANGETEKASLFSLKGKDEAALVEELKRKITNHLSSREGPGIFKFESGAMLQNNTDIQIEVRDGRLLIDGKIVVIKRENSYLPLPSAMIQTYTLLKATEESRILKISDEYDQERKDGIKGFLFALDQALEVEDLGSCLILYRSHAEIPA